MAFRPDKYILTQSVISSMIIFNYLYLFAGNTGREVPEFT